jgi:hypothetical protein|tara:strand:+ start:394 stop:1146 length:753 start_codon:yes stop_codon:yes gene_type:complete
MKLDLLLPTTLSDIPLSRYQEFIKMKEASNDDEFIAQKMIQIFCGIDLKDVGKIKMKHLNELINHFTEVFSEKPKLIRRFHIENIEFAFIPKLDEITFGEYVDLEHHLQNWETYHKAMAVMYRPLKDTYKDKYTIVDYEPNEDMQDLMKFAPLDVAISSSLFFWTIASELLNLTINYLQSELTMMTTSSSTAKGKILGVNGDGIVASMRSLKEMLPSLTKLADTDLLNVSPISHSKNKKTKSKQTNLNNK